MWGSEPSPRTHSNGVWVDVMLIHAVSARIFFSWLLNVTVNSVFPTGIQAPTTFAEFSYPLNDRNGFSGVVYHQEFSRLASWAFDNRRFCRTRGRFGRQRSDSTLTVTVNKRIPQEIDCYMFHTIDPHVTFPQFSDSTTKSYPVLAPSHKFRNKL